MIDPTEWPVEYAENQEMLSRAEVARCLAIELALPLRAAPRVLNYVVKARQEATSAVCEAVEQWIASGASLDQIRSGLNNLRKTVKE